MTSLATMNSRVAFGLGQKGGISSHIDTALNEATLQHVLRVKPKESQDNGSFSITNATAAYDLGTNVSTSAYAVMYVRNTTDDEVLVQGTEYEWHLQKQDTSVASNLGQPHKWAHVEDDLVIYDKIPDSTSRTIEVRFLARPATMTSAVAFPLEEEHERVVEQLAKSLVWLDLGNEQKAISAMQSYEALLEVRFQPEEVEDEHAIFQMTPVSNLDNAD